MLWEQNPGAERCRADPAGAQPVTQPEEVRMHEGLTARKDHPLYAQGLNIGDVALQVCGADLLDSIRLPDVAHHAPAVAPAVRIQYQDRQALNGIGTSHECFYLAQGDGR